MDDVSEPMTAAYGLRVEGLGPLPGLALHGAQRWPAITMTRELTDEQLPVNSVVGEDGATIVNVAAVLSVDRASASVRVRSAAPAQDADLVHPALWPVAAVFARWGGSETLHAGAFVAPGGTGAWGVMADSGGGKTAFLASLALAGAEVLVDDLLVLEGADCYAGPRALDLRPDTIAQLQLGDRITVPVRSTSRERLVLEPCEGRWPVHGFVELAWGPELGIERLSPSAALAALARQRRVIGLGAELDVLLELAGRPVLRLTRPRDWGQAPESVQRVLGAVS